MAVYALPPDTKFAAIHLCRCTSRGIPEVLPLNNMLSAHSTPVMNLTEMDASRIGVDYARAFGDSIALMASMQSSAAGVLDGESLLLEGRAHMLLYGVLMQGVPEFWPGIITIGSKRGDEEAWANRLSTMDRFLRNPDATPFAVTPEALRAADAVVPGLIEVFPNGVAPPPDFARLRRGVNSLIAGWKAGSVLERLHKFVRALDAIMILEASAGERQFVERTAQLVRGDDVENIAREIYRLRSLDEHLSDWPTKLGYIKEPERRRFVSLREFQAEVAAGEAYRRILSEPAILGRFRHDEAIKAFWASRAGGPIIDLDAHAGRFHQHRDV